MHGLVKVKSPNNISKWQMGFNSAFKGLNRRAVAVTLSYIRRVYLHFSIILTKSAIFFQASLSAGIYNSDAMCLLC
jgi:hypothetical protein